MVSKHRHLDRLPVRKQRQRSDQTRRKIKLQIRTVAAIVSNGNLCSRRSRAFSRKRPPEWRRPLFPIGRGFSSRQSQFHIFERSNPVLSSGRGAPWGAPEILSISTFAPASELRFFRRGDTSSHFRRGDFLFPHFRATKSGLTSEARCPRRAPRPALAKARSMPPIGPVFVAPAQMCFTFD